MSDDLTISGAPGASSVSTEEIIEAADLLLRVHHTLVECSDQLVKINRRISLTDLRVNDAPVSGAAAEEDLARAERSLTAAVQHSAALREALVQSADAYSYSERSLATLSSTLSSDFAARMAAVLPFLALSLVPALGSSLGMRGSPVFSRNPFQQIVEALRPSRLGADGTAILSDPDFIQLVRLVIMTGDDRMVGGLLPPGSEQGQVNIDGLDIINPALSAAAIVGLLAPTGALRETPVSIQRDGNATTERQPTGLESRARRIPRGAAQVRIDRSVGVDGVAGYEVYIGGTKDFGWKPGTEPLDMTSNVNAIAGNDPGSMRAVRLAMADAGITAESPVLFDGYSQGGLIAAQLVSSGDFNAKGLLTFGAPAGQVAVPTGIPWVALEHRDDLVPATGGVWGLSDPVLVTREVYAGSPVPTGIMMPAHGFENYEHTAMLADSAVDARLTAAKSIFDSFAAPAGSISSQLYDATRETAIPSR